MKNDNLLESAVFDPPVHVTKNGREIHISIDLPGVTEEQIRIDLENTLFTVSILNNDKPVKKTVQVPKGARFYKKKFSDGVLEIFLEKPVP
jgi:HSP20 family molecular chaperone IbpA